MINFDLDFFFNQKKLNFNNDILYKENLKKTIIAGNQLIEEFKIGKNEILKTFTSKYQKNIRNLKEEFFFNKKKKIVIGLGGSSSGAKALSYYLEDNIIFFDNLDYNYLNNFLENNSIQDFVIFVVSKSGDTYETLAILNLIINHSQKIKYFDIFKNIIVITEDKKSFLKDFTETNKIRFVKHNPKIGGRFSVISETGLLPFIDLPIEVENITEKYLNLLNDYEDDKSPIKNSAIILTCMKKFELNMYFNLLYNYKLKHFSYWFHQLHAESLGKNCQGLTPATSICPKDHHSMMQLYLDGPNDKFFNIFSPQDERFFDSFGSYGFKNIEKYSPNELLNRQFKSVIEVFSEKKIPHRVINISDHKNPNNLIELFSYFLLETIVLGHALGINSYDQPAVKLIKDKI